MIDNLKRYWAPALFSLGFAMFLGISIPKVGGVFLIFAPAQNDLIWKIASYGAAFTIDVLVGWLTFATTAKHRRWYIQVTIWLFILSLSLYSIFLNWVYDQLHTPGMTISAVWSESMFPGWNLGQLTNLLVSAIPAGILGFALIARLIREESAPLSLDELRKLAAESGERVNLEKQLFTASMGKQTARITGLIAAGKEVASSLVKGQQTSQFQVLTEEVMHPITEEQNTLFLEGNPPESDPFSEEENIPQTDALERMLEQFPLMRVWHSPSLRSITFAQIIEATGLSEKQILNRLERGVIKRTPRDPKRITKESFINWWKVAWVSEVRRQQSAQLRAITLVPEVQQSNGQHHHQEVL